MRHPKAVLAVIATTALATSCGTVEQYSKLRTPTDRTLHAGVGQAVFRIHKTRDLPNLWGKADLYGEKVDAGYQELRYVGMADASTVIFSYREFEVHSNETTMSRRADLD